MSSLMDPEKTLLPCPFCGSEARWATTDGSEFDTWEIQCSNIDCPLIFIGGNETGEELAAAWNRREGKETA